MEKRFKVVGPHAVLGFPPGKEFTGELAHEAALIEGGHLEVVKVLEKLECPSCAERLKRPPKFDSHEDLAAHYGEKHPGLVPPSAGEEE